MVAWMQIRPAMDSDAPALDVLFAASEQRHGREAISEHKRLRVLAHEVIDLVATDAHRVVGYGQAAWHGGGREPHWALELLTGPDADEEAWGRLLDTLVRAIPRSRSHHLWITRDDDLPRATGRGWAVDRSLHEMHRSLPVDEDVVLPEGIEIRRFRRGVDDAAWLDVHNEAFAGHPEVGGMTVAELEMRLEQEWFDEQGLLMAWRDDELTGSCWTKLHPDGVGEIYLIGVRAGERGRGLGRQLVLAGLQYLADRRGATDGMLYVDTANTAALSLYVRLGFSAKTTIHRLHPPPRDP